MPTVTLIARGKTAYDALVTQLGPDLYRLDEELGLMLAAESEDEISLFPRYGDTIKTRSTNDGILVFERVHARGPFKHFDFTLSREVAESPELAAFLREVSATGGHWQSIMGGLLFISIPEHSELDVPAAIQRAKNDAH